MSVSDLDVDLDKSVIIDAGRINKLPFTFSLINVLPKCRQHSSMTFSLFTKCEDETGNNYRIRLPTQNTYNF